MIPVPKLLSAQIVHGESSHLPAYDTLPEEFQRAPEGNVNSPYVVFVYEWFTFGKTANQITALKEREAVNRLDALNALVAIWHSDAGKNQQSIFGIAYLLSQWFTLNNGD